MFSLVVPTYNRPFFLERLLRYYAHLHFAFPLVVADSSFGPSLDENLRIVGSVKSSLTVTHQIYSPDMNPYAKLATTLATSQSKYAAVCADDDFLVPDGIAKCLDFLEAHPDYSIAHGRSAAVLIAARSDNGLNGEIRDSSTYPQRTIESDDPASRLEDHLTRHTATYYSIHRRLQILANLQQADDQTVDYRFGELLASCLSIIQGKAKCLDVLYMVRRAELGPPTRKYSEKMLPWDDLAMLDDFSIRCSRFQSCLAKELSIACGSSIEDANAEVSRAFLLYLALNSSSAVGQESRRLAGRCIERIGRLLQTLPGVARAAILDGELLRVLKDPRSSYRRVLAMKDEMSLPSLLNSRSPFHEQFMDIHRYLQPDPAPPTNTDIA
jgi:glycosyltransferase domain-containing protein